METPRLSISRTINTYGNMDDKVEEVLNHLTPPEKISLLSGSDAWHTVAIPSRGVRSVKVRVELLFND